MVRRPDLDGLPVKVESTKLKKINDFAVLLNALSERTLYSFTTADSHLAGPLAVAAESA